MCEKLFLLLNHNVIHWRIGDFHLMFFFFLLFSPSFSTFHCLDGTFFCIFHIACNPADPFHFHADVINHLTAWALDRCDLLQLFIHTFCPSVHSWVWCIFCVATIIVYSTLLCSLHQIIWRRSPVMIKKKEWKTAGMRISLTKHPNCTQGDTFERWFFFMQTSIHSFPSWILKA